MKIAIDCRSILNPDGGELAGIGHYTHFLVKHLLAQDDENAYVLFFDARASKGLIAEIIGASRNARAVVLPLSKFKKLFPYAWSHRVVAKAIADEKADVFHAPTGSLPMGYRGKSVITVHDLAIYDHPEWFPGGQLFSKRMVVPASVRNASKIIAVSHATKRDAVRLFAVPPEKIRVIHEGVVHREAGEHDHQRASVLLRHGLDRPYFLFLGTIEPRKNVLGLVHAFGTLAEQFPSLADGTDLVIAGATGWKSDETLAYIAKINKSLGGERVRMLGYLPAEDKEEVMAHALAFMFPTLYEGFGLPVLEAMSLGVPVVSSDVSSIPEIVGRDGVLVDPTHRSELMLAMKHLLENPDYRRELGMRGLHRSIEFRWERTAGETLEVYEEVAKNTL